MRTAAATHAELHPKLGALVDRAEKLLGSRMAAYERVADRVGASASWVRKFLGRQPVRLDGHVLENINGAFEAYRDSCGRWEDEAARRKAAFFAVGEVSHEMAESTGRRTILGSDAGSASARAAAVLVRSLVDEERK